MLSTFARCPQKYKLVYIDHIRKKEEGIEAFAGKVVHEVLEWLYSSENIKKTIMLDQIIRKYNEIWLDRWHDKIMVYSKENNFEKSKNIKAIIWKGGMDCLVNYSHEYGPKFYEENQEGNIQNTLTIDNIRLEKKYIGRIAGYNFAGIMDRVNIGNEVVTIIDYKTTKKSKSGDQARKDLQMGIYYKLAKENLDSKKILLRLIYLRVPKQVDFEISDKDYEKIECKITNLIDRILSETKYEPNEGFLCNWCYHWQECEAKKTDNPSLRVL